MKVHDVKLEPLCNISMKEFSEFGRIIGRDEDVDHEIYNLHPYNVQPSVDSSLIKSYWNLIDMKPSENDKFSIGMLFLKPKDLGAPIEWLECHLETYEFFFPLGGKDFVFLLCPPMEKPTPEKTRAFLVGPNEGVMLDKGTWHYAPFSLNGISPCVMPRYGKLANCEGDVTEAYGKKWDTKGGGFIKGFLHAMNSKYFGGDFTDDEYKVRIIL
ncbi:MAG: ureidoglycolate lyase [Tissierellales bacterium]|nr:ureidoglycolate lyase [Tissierellales bacterium]MBN2826351.1 ureidoglycolate lyase [Tissierellales bacterium]